MFLLLFAELVWSLQFLMCKMLFLGKVSWKPLGLCWCNLHKCRENNRGEKAKIVQFYFSICVQQAQHLSWTLQPALVSDLLLHLSHFLPVDKFSSIIPLWFCVFCSPRGCSGCEWSKLGGFVLFDISVPGGGHWVCPPGSQAVAQTKPEFTVPLLIPLKIIWC